MKKIFAGIIATLFATAAYAQNAGTVTNHAFAVGKGPGVSGYTSLLCGSAQLAVGQAAADPICRTVSGDWTLSAAGIATLATVNANVGTFGSATQAPQITLDAKGRATAATSLTVTPAVGSITGLGAGCATWLATPSSANLRGCVTDETGTGLAYFQGGDIGTPSAGVGSNLSALNASSLTLGTVAAARMPALTGDVTSTIGTVATTIAANAVTNAKAAQMAANTIKANNTGGTANAADITPGAAGAMLCNPQFLGSGAGASTYTTPTCNGVTAKYIVVKMVGAGGGGAGSGTTPGAATAGTASTFGTALLSAGGGAAGAVGAATGVGAAGGVVTGCDYNLSGGAGQPGENTANRQGGAGGASFFGGQAPAGILLNVAGLNAAANTGSGGSGASAGATLGSGGGGAAGGYCEKLIVAPLASYNVVVGAKGTGGTLGTSGSAGGNGADGVLGVMAYFQ